MSLASRLVALVIRLYPESFRDRFGAEMLATYLDRRDALRDRPGATRQIARLTAGTVMDLLISLPGVRREERDRGRRRTGSFPAPRTRPMRRFATDLRRVARGLGNQPGFALVAILTLALGIGANTAVFSVLNSVVLAPLPYDRPGELVRLYAAAREHPGDRGFLTGLDILDLRDEKAAFASVGAFYSYRETGGDLAAPGGPPRRVRLLEVSGDYFRALRASPAMGRTFSAEEERVGITRVVLSHRLWREVAGGDPSIIGRTIELNGTAFEVIGVMRPGFRDLAGDDVAAWIPASLERGGENNRVNHYLSAVARLGPGVSAAQAQARVDAMTTRLAPEYGSGDVTRIIRVIPLQADVVGESKTSLVVLMGAAGLVLLIACLNVANLFLARSLGQSRDLAVRTALGADRARLVSERLAESVMVAGVGGLVGSVVAYWGVKLLLAVSPESLARAEEVGFDPRLLGFAIGVTVLTGLLFGAWPAWRASRVDPTDALRDGARGNTSGRGSRRARDLLVSGQVALAVILLIGAGILIRSFVALQRVDLGFRTDHVATFEINLPDARYRDPTARVRFHENFQERLRAVPGVEKVGATSWLPANGAYHQWGFRYVDPAGARQWSGAETRVIDGDYFGALEIPIEAGRMFERAELDDTAGVALISADLAKTAYGDRDPLGQWFETGGGRFRVVGVVGAVAQVATGARSPVVYLGHRQFAPDRNWTLTYVVRTGIEPGQIFAEARAALAAIDPALVLFQPRPLDAVVERHRARERFTLLLMGTFAGVALMLAAIGLYGVLSYTVTQRGHEIGVRMALGARPGQVRGAVLRHGVGIAAAGMSVGLVGAVALGRMLETVIAGAKARDPVVFGAVVLVLGLVSVLAGYLPALRATRVDPLEALRSD